VGMIGFILLLSSSNIRIQYAGTFLGAAGIYPTVRDRTNPPGRRVREILLT
jgi:hypothetical protein